MKYALALVALVSVLAMAEPVVDISGFAKAWFYMYGEEGANPENTFRAYDWTTVKGRLSDDVYAFVGASYSSWDSDGDLQVCDAYLTMDIVPELSIKAGQFNIPLGWANCCPGGNLYFLDRAGVVSTDEFGWYSDRDLGVNLHGQFDMVGVDVGYFNGTGIHADASEFWNKEFVGKLTLDATDWLRIAGGVGMIGQPQIDTLGTVLQEEWSSMGINAYALADYPMSESADLIFEAEYWNFGYAGPDVDNVDEEAGMDLYATLGVHFMLDGGFLHSIMPAVRYEMYSPQEAVTTGADRAEDNTSWIDACVNCFITPSNTLQLGIRNWSFEDENLDGYTDMYLGWRLNY
ncbi:MAG: hypothetical protein AVO35_07955 [Candidatus Aegiribacteria sp. MLS_C]|nr:MAG: hypothetical protein AVO35_07955 [Candidatus Aegiribacteria sp. MLS_C]